MVVVYWLIFLFFSAGIMDADPSWTLVHGRKNRVHSREVGGKFILELYFRHPFNRPSNFDPLFREKKWLAFFGMA